LKSQQMRTLHEENLGERTDCLAAAARHSVPVVLSLLLPLAKTASPCLAGNLRIH
ncbi:hypothetical protein E4U23_004002, partial [Claviceps purpurea]